MSNYTFEEYELFLIRLYIDRKKNRLEIIKENKRLEQPEDLGVDNE